MVRGSLFCFLVSVLCDIIMIFVIYKFVRSKKLGFYCCVISFVLSIFTLVVLCLHVTESIFCTVICVLWQLIVLLSLYGFIELINDFRDNINSIEIKKINEYQNFIHEICLRIRRLGESLK